MEIPLPLNWNDRKLATHFRVSGGMPMAREHGFVVFGKPGRVGLLV